MKDLYVSPEKERAPRTEQLGEIKINQYQKTVKDELGNFTTKEFMNIFRDMCYIREFETMLYTIKTTNGYEGIEYNNPGPAHLGMGQEAAYVGEAFYLTPEDFSFGSHRSHGEILARSLRAVEIMDETELMNVMKEFFDGRTLQPVYDESKSVREIGKDFVLYGTMAEILARANGFNSGLGGSMHAFFTKFGVFPNNAIVGGSGSIAPGAALYKLINHKPGVVVCNIGDGATGCGPVWEGLMISAMDQVRTLWPTEGGVPIIFNINNNFYAMGDQTCGETMGYQFPARIGAGVMPGNMHAEKVDGYNPLAVIDAYRRKIPVAKAEGPVMLELTTYRFSGHSPSDASTYRTKEEIEDWQTNDSILSYGAQLVEAGVCTQKELDDIRDMVKSDLRRILAITVDDNITPRLDIFGKDPDCIERMMFTNKKIRSMDTTREPEMLVPKSEFKRLVRISKKKRFGRNPDGSLVSKNTVYNLRDGIAEPIINKFYEDPTFIAFGEDVRDWGGSFAVYRDMTEGIPYHRFFNTPISEAGIVGAAVGYAMAGGRCCAELMYIDFLGRAGDEVFNQLSKWQSMSSDVINMPVVLRMSIGSKYGAQHSQDWSALCAHIPGLKVVFPATPYDAKGLMQTALNGTDPVIFLESQRIYDVGELFHEGGVPEEEYEIEIGDPDVKRAGKDVTILSIGAVLYRAVEAADILERDYGLSAEIIDARSLVPFNYEKVMESVKKTGRIVIVGDACERGSFMRTLASNITELCFDDLDAPPVVVGARNWITPCHEMEEAFFPQPSWIVDAIHEKILPLKGHVCTANFTELEQVRRNKLGV